VEIKEIVFSLLASGSMMEEQHSLLTSFQRKQLQKSLETELRSLYRQRIQIMLMADAGHSQTQICEMLGCAQVTARYWITIAQSGNAHRWNDRPMGRPKIVNQQFLDRLQELVASSPRDYGYGFRHWTAQWLARHLAKELGIKVSDRHINSLLKEMGLSTRGQTPTSLESQVNQTSGIKIDDLQTTQISGFEWQFNFSKTNELI
jgi:transposase